jgi:hypothetical protein
VPLSKSAVNDKVLSLDVTKVSHFCAESFDYFPVKRSICECWAKPSYSPNLGGRLLRKRWERPNCRRGAE